jgi:hypothetical protein
MTPDNNAHAIGLKRGLSYSRIWLKKVSEFEGALFPGLEIKAFDTDQKVEAEAWLSN